LLVGRPACEAPMCAGHAADAAADALAAGTGAAEASPQAAASSRPQGKNEGFKRRLRQVDGSPAVGIRGTPACDPAGPHRFRERLLRVTPFT
jgi:hypothetical protein